MLSTKNRELSFKFLDELQAKKKTEFAIAATSTPKEVKPALEKKVWNPLSLDLNASTRSKVKPQGKAI